MKLDGVVKPLQLLEIIELKLLGLKYSDRVVMVISVGEEADRGTWGPRFRISSDKVIHEV